MGEPDHDAKMRESLEEFERLVEDAEGVDKTAREDVSRHGWAVDWIAEGFFDWMWEASKIRGRSDTSTGYALAYVLSEAMSIAHYYCNPDVRLNQRAPKGMTLEETWAKYGVLILEGTLAEWQAKRKAREEECEKAWRKHEESDAKLREGMKALFPQEPDKD